MCGIAGGGGGQMSGTCGGGGGHVVGGQTSRSTSALQSSKSSSGHLICSDGGQIFGAFGLYCGGRHKRPSFLLQNLL